MALAINRVKVTSNSSIRVEFTSNLNSSINETNVSIEPVLSTVLTPTIIGVTVYNNFIDINTLPLTPKVKYIIKFYSSSNQKFVSYDGKEFLVEDGQTNQTTIISWQEPDDTIKAALKHYLKDNIFTIEDGTLAESVVDSQAVILSKALHDIGQLKNDNYLELPIIDEKKVRGEGAYDRLSQEGAFVVNRVGTTLTGYSKTGKISFSSFPYGQISLQQKTSINEEVSLDNFIINVSNGQVIKLTSITFKYSNGNTFTYDPSIYGYQLLNNDYDKERASLLYTLTEKQIKISEKIVEDGINLPKASDSVYVTYDYKYAGRNIDDESVSVTEVINIVREVCPPIINEFSLNFAPIVTELDVLSTSGGVQFLNPRACIPFSESHPAFITEIPYRLEALPAFPGEYCVNYETGKVFVYGAETNDGTGEFPPAATYKYRKTYTNELDYNYNKETDSLAAVESRDITGKSLSINFSYEDVLVPGIDYISNVHKESLNERIDNRLLSLNSLATKNYPITNAFRLINETTGELYNITRFDDYKIYFSYNKPPTIVDITRERAGFQEFNNEILLVNEEYTNSNGIRIFEIQLSNSNIVNSTEEHIGSSFDTSMQFSNQNIFIKERYFDGQTVTTQTNYNKINVVGQYVVDYKNGLIYVGVSSNQNEDIGSVNYKAALIKTNNKHITYVSGLYNSLNSSNSIKLNISYDKFADQNIEPTEWNRADERFINGSLTNPYIYDNGVIYVTDDVKSVYGVYDLYNLDNDLDPINFGTTASFSNSTISLSPVKLKENYTVASGNTITISHQSSGFDIKSVLSIIDQTGAVRTGTVNGKTITISGTSIVGQQVLVLYTVGLNGSATPIVNYNRGDIFVDYGYLQDELLVSYEYGDNCLDFRQSRALEPGDEYYVSYRVGALRNSLQSNFGELMDIPVINTFDTSFDREVYRDVLQGALQSFTNGPTKDSISTLIESITKTKPNITEALFDLWSLGNSSLYSNKPTTTGDVKLVPGKHDLGLYLSSNNSSLSYPVSSNLRLEEGTLEFWTIPGWDGIDNDATLTFSNISIASSSIWIGSTSYHPASSTFSINKNDEIDHTGIPSKMATNSGLFIYYSKEVKKWILAIKGVSNVSGKITSTGNINNVNISNKVTGDVIRTLSKEVQFTLSQPSSGTNYTKLSLTSDNKHYLFDFAEDDTKNRFSIFKDERGYIVFEIFDKYGKQYRLSKNISNWLAGERHFISTSWKLNTKHKRDEMHLFIDGVEVSNVLKYDSHISNINDGDAFRDIKDEVIGTVSKKIIRGANLVTIMGSNVVTSPTVNFQSEGIVIGDKIEILEIGFGTSTITNVAGNTLTLDSPSFTNLTDARFCVNPFVSKISDNAYFSSNTAVYVSNSTETELPGRRAEFPAYAIDKNAFLEPIITIYGPANVGDKIIIRTLGLNYSKTHAKTYLWSDQSILKTQLPTPISLDDIVIIPIILPLTIIGPSNSTLSGGIFTSNVLIPTNVSNTTEGRILSVKIGGGNIDFTSNVQVIITGTNNNSNATETLNFFAQGTQKTTYAWKTISSIVVKTKPVNTAINSASIEVSEAYSITKANGNNSFPIIRYSYIEKDGYGLDSNGAGLLDGGFFKDVDIDKMIVIDSPLGASGSYQIMERFDDGSVLVNPVPPVFVNGHYKLYNTTIGRSGFSNGFFKFELAGSVNTQYNLPKGLYELYYDTYLSVKLDNINNSQMFIGSDYQSKNQSCSVIDELRILSRMLTDIRTGETISASEKSITTDYNRLVPFKADKDTLFLCHFDDENFVNVASFWKMASKKFLQSAESVNTNFGSSLVIEDRPFIVDNDGKLRTNKEGSIEFWVSPNFDTFNDPIERYYFDASSAIVEEQNSLTSSVVKIGGKTKNILSVRLVTDIDNSGINYFEKGSIAKDNQTITLGRKLPNQNTKVKITYIPSGYVGNRISIYKDKYGFLVFNVKANDIEYKVSQPIFWSKYSWHKILVSFKFNNSDGRDEIRLFVDGRENGIIRFGQCFLFGQGIVFGQGSSGDVARLIANIDFNDNINQFYIGSTFEKGYLANARFDNLKISSIAKRVITCAGMAVDENWQASLDNVYPVIEDLYTTYLLNFDNLSYKKTDFAKLRNNQYGVFNFAIDIFDSFDIISDNSKVKQIINELILAIKPAQSKVEINIQ